jgi:hypothetical protein
LAFGYLWEADFFVKLQGRLLEELANRERPEEDQNVAKNSLQTMLNHGTVLATIEDTRIPISQKHAWRALSNLLARGYLIRKDLGLHLKGKPFGIPRHTDSLTSVVEAWINTLSIEELQTLTQPLEIDSNTASNVREFVRYLLLPRSSDDDTTDQADFYYLSRTRSRLLWFQPGPEWLVVVTSLLGGCPGGECTLGQLLDDLRKLGLRVERRVLVSLLEEAGLSSDSPDADNALVIEAGF